MAQEKVPKIAPLIIKMPARFKFCWHCQLWQAHDTWTHDSLPFVTRTHCCGCNHYGFTSWCSPKYTFETIGNVVPAMRAYANQGYTDLHTIIEAIDKYISGADLFDLPFL